MKLSKVLAFVITALMVLTILPVFPVSSQEANSMWIVPSALTFQTDTVSPGYRFNVTVWLYVTSTNQFSWQVTLYYNTSQLKVVDAGYTHSKASKSKWGTHSTGDTSAASIIVESNYVGAGEMCLGDAYVPAGTRDSLIYVTFEIIASPSKGETLISVLNINNADTFVLDTNLDEIAITKNDATYSYKWVAPPKPYCAVDPASREFGPYPPMVVGVQFTEKIYIKALDAAWWLHSASFTLDYNSSLLKVVNVVFDPLWGATASDPLPDTDGSLSLSVENPSSNPSGDVLVATVTFEIIFQDACVPVGTRPVGSYDESLLDLECELYDTMIKIPTNPCVDGKVRIYCLQLVSPPYLEVSSVTMGPEPVLGEEFDVTVSIKGVSPYHYLVAVEFVLSYPGDLIEYVGCTEGPFMPYWASMQQGSLGTFFVFVSDIDTVVGCGDMILPNEEGVWHEPFPEGDGVIATLRFKVKYQSYPETFTGSLNIVHQLAVGLDGPDTQNVVEVSLDPPVNGTYTITTSLPGRVIDVYGGAVNRGYGSIPFPAPYGGQGLDKPMDLVIPQSVVYLFADVTYNYWPVQSKDVGFEIEGPFDHETGEPKPAYFVRKYANRTDSNGVAWIKFQMPWPCKNPEDLFGKYKVTATVDICGEVVMDTLEFDYYYLVEITKVTTNKYEYNHGEDVVVTIEFRSKAQQTYPVLFSVVIQDELGTHFGAAIVEATVGGAKFCTWKNYVTTVSINIPKWAFAGIATIYVSAFDKNPSAGGAPWCPTYGIGWPPNTTPPKIAIQPR